MNRFGFLKVAAAVPHVRIADCDYNAQHIGADAHIGPLGSCEFAEDYRKNGKIVAEQNLTTLMVTHNMRDAIVHGNRLIMMNEGQVILDISGEEKKNLTVEDLLEKFEEISGEEFANDKALLSK